MQLQSSTNSLTKQNKYYSKCNKYNNEVLQIQSVPDQFRQRFSSPANNHLSPFRVSEGHRWTNPDEEDDDTHCRMFRWKIEILQKETSVLKAIFSPCVKPQVLVSQFQLKVAHKQLIEDVDQLFVDFWGLCLKMLSSTRQIPFFGPQPARPSF